MTSRHLLLPTPQGIGSGQTATLNMPLGPTYETLFLELKAGPAAGSAAEIATGDWGTVIDDIRVVVDGRTQIEITAYDLAKLNKYFGQTLEPGVLPLHFSQPWARTIGGEDLGSYGTSNYGSGGISSLTLEVDFKDAIQIEKFAVRYIEGERKPYGPHTTIRRLAKSMASVGVDEVADIRLGAYNLLGLHVTNANIGYVQVSAEGVIVHETAKKSRAAQHRISGRVRQTGMTHIDFIGRNRIAFMDGATGEIKAEAFPMALQDFRVKLDFAQAPGTYEIYQHAIEGA